MRDGPGDAVLLLMTPGPTRVPDRVRRAGGRPMIHHRTPEFSAELATALDLLRPVFGTSEAVLPVHTTGRGAMEAAVCNLFSPGDEIAVACNGKFGEMWAALAESYGLVVHRIASDWGADVGADDVAQVVERHPALCAVAVVYGESSTGTAVDIAAVGRAAQAHHLLYLVDGISSIGGMPFAFDEWNVDCAIVASQKCLMAAPGLAFVVLSDRARAAAENARLPRNYWDLADIRRHVTRPRPDTPGTTPVHLMLQVAEALRLMHEEGLAEVYRRHAAMAACCRTGAAALDLELQCPAARRHSATLTALRTPPGIAPSAIRDGLKARGILTAAGLGPYEQTAFRIGHLGDIRPADVERTLSALRDVLAALQ